MNWLIHQLFGAHATDHLTDKIKAAVALYMHSNPQATREAVIANFTPQGDTFIAFVLTYLPGWASGVLKASLLPMVPELIGNAYDLVTKAIAGSQP